MENSIIKAKDFYKKAQNHFKTADHMAYVTFSLLKEQRLMIKIIHELYNTSINLVKAYLFYEYSLKSIRLFRNSKMNIKTFKQKIAPKYFSEGDIENILKIFEIEQKHKKAPVEFVRKDKFVILLGDKYETLTIEKIRSYIYSVKVALGNFPLK